MTRGAKLTDVNQAVGYSTSGGYIEMGKDGSHARCCVCGNEHKKLKRPINEMRLLSEGSTSKTMCGNRQEPGNSLSVSSMQRERNYTMTEELSNGILEWERGIKANHNRRVDEQGSGRNQGEASHTYLK